MNITRRNLLTTSLGIGGALILTTVLPKKGMSENSQEASPLRKLPAAKPIDISNLETDLVKFENETGKPSPYLVVIVDDEIVESCYAADTKLGFASYDYTITKYGYSGTLTNGAKVQILFKSQFHKWEYIKKYHPRLYQCRPAELNKEEKKLYNKWSYTPENTRIRRLIYDRFNPICFKCKNKLKVLAIVGDGWNDDLTNGQCLKCYKPDRVMYRWIYSTWRNYHNSNYVNGNI